MPAFRTRGSTGQAPNTIWFGALPDRLNMLAPAGVSGPLNQIVNNPIPAHFANLWTPSGVTLGAFTTAPDGSTNVAQALTEDTSTGLHLIASGTMFSGMQGNGLTGALRLAGFWKNNGRRVGLQCAAVAGTLGTVYAVFDLAGGQVGVPGTTTGALAPNIKVLNTQIIRSLNGFYLCILDFAMQGVSNELFITAFLDNGTGTAALSNSYTGSGAGTFGWRTNMMPISSYGINTPIFFDDFTSLSTIDTTNSKAAGFKWYVDGNWANWMLNGALPFDPTWLSITGGTVLNITQNKQNLNAITLQTTAQLTPPNYIGTTFSNAKPTLYEIRRADLLNTVRGQFIATFWAQDMTWAASNSTGPNSGKLSQGREMDFVESDYGPGGNTVNYPHVGGIFYNSIVNAFSTIGTNIGATEGNTVGSTPLYYSTQAYGQSVNAVNGSDGIRYNAIEAGFVPPGNPPPSVGKWSELDYPNGGFPNFPATPFDQAQLHTYSTFVAPYYGSSQAGPNGFDAAGVMMEFTDGLLISLATYWNPLVPITGETTSPLMHTTDGHQMAIAIGADAGSGSPGITMQIDFVRVMQ